VLVIEQGTVLNRIDYNIENAAQHVEKTVIELKVAKKHQERAGKFTCVFALLLLCTFMVVVLILKAAALGG
jgi:syntaxin 16